MHLVLSQMVVMACPLGKVQALQRTFSSAEY